ncbi:hypothetical protein TNCV_543471 [Trichonephila clavipes]|nr:hypothetical protein TNCV_543471 [Trichonephila clavipes]
MPAIIGYLNHWDTAAPDVVWKFGEWNASLDVAIEPRFKIMSSVDDDEQNWQFVSGSPMSFVAGVLEPLKIRLEEGLMRVKFVMGSSPNVWCGNSWVLSSSLVMMAQNDEVRRH